MRCFKKLRSNLSFWEALKYLENIENEKAFISLPNADVAYYFDKDDELRKVSLEEDVCDYWVTLRRKDLFVNLWEVWACTNTKDIFISLKCFDKGE